MSTTIPEHPQILRLHGGREIGILADIDQALAAARAR